MITFLKRAWPLLRFFGRAPEPRSNIRRLETGTPRTLETGQVRKIE
jgi:hypothetical protein